MLVPNEEYLNEVLHMLDNEEVKWNDVFSFDKIHQTIYKLFIAASCIYDVLPEEKLLFSHDYYCSQARKLWKIKFLKKGGNNFLENIISKIPSILNNKEIRMLILLALDILRCYLFAALKVNTLLPNSVKQIVAPYFNKGEAIKNNEEDLDMQMENVCKETANQNYEIYDRPFGDDVLVCLEELKDFLKNESGILFLNAVNFQSLLLNMLNILDIFTKESTVEIVELYKIVQRASSIIFCIMLYKPDLYGIINSENESFRNVMLKGIMSKKAYPVRPFFQNLIFFLCSNVYCKEIPFTKNPLGNLIIGMLEVINYVRQEDCSEIHQAIVACLDLYKSLEKETELINLTDKLQEIIFNIKNYKSNESMRSIIPDNGLIGLLQIATKMLSMPSVSKKVNPSQRQEIIEEILFNGLFPLKESNENIYSFKCKTTITRQAAYKLLEIATSDCEESTQFILKEYLPLLPSKIIAPTGWGYSPEKEERSLTGFAGIRNLGCICYMISVIQQFFMIEPLRNAILSVDDQQPSKSNNLFGIDDNFLHQLQSIFGFLLLSNRRDISPSSFCYSFKDQDGRPTNTAIQQDAHEFLNIILDRLENKLKTTSYQYLLQSIFRGKICNQIICKQCGKIKNNYEDLYTLTLEIKNQRNFQEAMTKFISDSLVTGYFCEQCKAQVEVVKRTLLSNLPNILIVHLQRFTFNFDTLMNEKVYFIVLF